MIVVFGNIGVLKKEKIPILTDLHSNMDWLKKIKTEEKRKREGRRKDKRKKEKENRNEEENKILDTEWYYKENDSDSYERERETEKVCLSRGYFRQKDQVTFKMNSK